MTPGQSILIKNADHDGRKVDIYIEGDTITRITPAGHHRQAAVGPRAGREIDACGMNVFPPFYNMHTHAAMTLLRGYADDKPLKEWLERYIWPVEATFTGSIVQAGVKLACLEMIKSGTVFFNDMYWRVPDALPVVRSMGLRAVMGVTFTDFLPDAEKEKNFRFIEEHAGGRNAAVTLSVAPHAVYTAGGKLLRRCAEVARRSNTMLHIHVSETRGEVEECMKRHGCTPVAYLDRIGFLGDDVVAAHAVHVTDGDIAILSRRGVTVAHCPVSNLKLSSGMAPVHKMLEAGCRVALGTDGCASNNNLDMREEMKTAALLAKAAGGACTLPANAALAMATRAGAEAARTDAGAIEEGRKADLILVRNDVPSMTPMYSPVSNWVYSAGSSLVDTVICNGRLLMQGRKVDGEADILLEARDIATRIAKNRK